MTPLPACPAEVPAWIEHAFVDSAGIRAADLPVAEVHAFVDEAVWHLTMRDLWLQDPRHAADLTHTAVTAGLVEYGEAAAGREDIALHDLISAWVRGHDLTAVSS